MRLLAAHVWNMDERSYPRRAIAAGLGGAPAEIVAEVLAGITRDGHRQPGRPCGHEQTLSGRALHPWDVAWAFARAEARKGAFTQAEAWAIRLRSRAR